jgi:hypothetical protein
MTPSGIEPATFRFAAQYLHHCATISGPLLDEGELLMYGIRWKISHFWVLKADTKLKISSWTA